MPGVLTGVACEMISVRPSSVNNVPSVATNDEIPTTDDGESVERPISHRHQQRNDHRQDEREAALWFSL